jgi:hypothetical protein
MIQLVIKIREEYFLKDIKISLLKFGKTIKIKKLNQMKNRTPDRENK